MNKKLDEIKSRYRQSLCSLQTYEDVRVLVEVIEKQQELIKTMLPIVEAAYWDQHTAGTMAGSGFNNKPQHLAGAKWGWWDSTKFKTWLVDALKILEPTKREEESK